MILLEHIVIALVKAGVKAYKASQARAAEQQQGQPAQGQSTEAYVKQVLAQATAASNQRSGGGAGEVHAVQALISRLPAKDPARDALADLVRDHLQPNLASGDDRSHRFYLNILRATQALAEQRSDPDRAALLRDVDTVAMACYQPLLDFQKRRGFPLSTQRTVSFLGESPGSLTPRFSRTPVAPIEVSVRLKHDAIGWPLIAREVGRDILLSVQGLREDLRVAAGMPQPPTNKLQAGYINQDEIHAALGAWHTELCADAIGALLLGPSYLAALTALHRSPDQPHKTRVVELSNGRVSSIPPPELRIVIADEVVNHLGHTRISNEIMAPWLDEHGEQLEFFFPIGGGRFAAVPEDFYTAPIRELAHMVCDQQVPSLAGMHLMDVPGLHYSMIRFSEAETAGQAFKRGMKTTGDPRTLVAGAAILGHRDPAQRVASLPWLRRSLAPKASTQAYVAAPIAGDESLTSPQVIRDALLLGELMDRKSL